MSRRSRNAVVLCIALLPLACGGSDGDPAGTGASGGAASKGGSSAQAGQAGQAGQGGHGAAAAGASGASSAKGGSTAGTSAKGGGSGAPGKGGAAGAAAGGASSGGAGGTTSTGKGGTTSAGQGGTASAGKGGAAAGGSAAGKGGSGAGGSGAGGTAAGGCGNIGTGDPACDACVTSTCCAQDQACTDNAACTAILDCLTPCADQTCADACLQKNPSGAQAFDDFVNCLQNQCGSACSGGGGSGGSSTTCDHDACTQGSPLGQSCDACAATVCAGDAFCCQQGWDGTCVGEAQSQCGKDCGAGGGGGSGGCDSVSCAKGCCDPAGSCVLPPVGAVGDAACGHQGAACVDCTAQGSFCTNNDYYPTCASCTPDCTGKACAAPDGCGGLCDGTCAAGTFCFLSSTSGQATFETAGCKTCDASTCPDGCCTPDGQCQGGYARTACGSGGVACADCGAQACTSTSPFGGTKQCGACGSGCLPSFPGAPAECTDDGCGNLCPGAACQAFGGQPAPACVLTGGHAMCQQQQGPCIPQFCDGCCDYTGTFGGTCVTGNLPGKCGNHAQSCVDCVAKGFTCDENARECEGCTPKCGSATSCGSGDGCGGVCTGAKGGSCAGGATCDDAGACTCPTPGQALCYSGTETGCIDVEADAANCGGCGLTCAPGVACVGGKCACPVGSHSCPGYAGQTVGSCVNLASDPLDCGYCGQKCAGACVEGACAACDAGKTSCVTSGGATCADLGTDSANCGTCGNACPAGVTCSGGKCDCGGGLLGCNGTCTDLATDPKNCGTCGDACPTGVTCAGGTCQCPGGTQLCGNQCVNPNVDPKNCGKCGVFCPSGQTCQGGACH